MTEKWVNIRVKESTRNSIRGECKDLFLKDNPKFKGFKITDDFMLKKMVEHYREG